MKTGTDLLFDCNPGDLAYAQRLKEMYQVMQYGLRPVFWIAYFSFTATYDLMPFLDYSKS